MIVKVQQSLRSSDNQKRVLAYDQGQNFMFEGPLLESVAKILGSRPKAYFTAEIEDQNLVLLDEVDAQPW